MWNSIWTEVMKRIPILGVMLALSLEDLHKNVHHPRENTLETATLLLQSSEKQIFRSRARNEGGETASVHEKTKKKTLTSTVY